MAIKHYKPITPGTRHMSVSAFDEIDKVKPEKKLLRALKRKAGRNCYGRITVRHRGGGAKRQYRVIDFKRNKDGVKAEVLSVEYDPNRTSNVALIKYQDGVKTYIVAPVGLKKGDYVESGRLADIKPGNALELNDIPVGTMVYSVELRPGEGGRLVRSAGASAQIMAKERKFVHLKLPSNEVRLIHSACRAVIGQVGNVDHENIKIGKAGRKRHMGWRPQVRGSAMNPCDHPHGGGEGKAPIGKPSPVTPWGIRTLGLKTRNKRKLSSKYIVKRRNAK